LKANSTPKYPVTPPVRTPMTTPVIALPQSIGCPQTDDPRNIRRELPLLQMSRRLVQSANLRLTAKHVCGHQSIQILFHTSLSPEGLLGVQAFLLFRTGFLIVPTC
jgi:hypothetical protein